MNYLIFKYTSLFLRILFSGRWVSAEYWEAVWQGRSEGTGWPILCGQLCWTQWTHSNCDGEYESGMERADQSGSQSKDHTQTNYIYVVLSTTCTFGMLVCCGLSPLYGDVLSAGVVTVPLPLPSPPLPPFPSITDALHVWKTQAHTEGLVRTSYCVTTPHALGYSLYNKCQQSTMLSRQSLAESLHPYFSM